MSSAMIPIKKSDGTIEYVTMAQFQAMQQQAPVKDDQVQEERASLNAWHGSTTTDTAPKKKEPKSKTPKETKKPEPVVSHEQSMSSWQGTPAVKPAVTSVKEQKHVEESAVAAPPKKKRRRRKKKAVVPVTPKEVVAQVPKKEPAKEKPVPQVPKPEPIVEKKQPPIPPPPAPKKEDVVVPEKPKMETPIVEKEPKKPVQAQPPKKKTPPPPPKPAMPPVTKKEVPPVTPKPEQPVVPAPPKEKEVVVEKKPKPKKEAPPMPVWNKEDHQSLLDTEVPDQPGAPVADKRDGEVMAIVTKLNLSIAENLQSRLMSLVRSRLKDVRTRSQVVDVLQKPIEGGGLGMDADQARDVAAKIDATIVSLEKAEIQPMDMSTTPEAPAPAVNPAKDAIDRLIKADQAAQPYHLQLQKKAKKDRVMHDVMQPPLSEQPRTTGPVDEFRQLSITDFRRLSQDPTEAAKEVEKKFNALKEESFLMFMDAVLAWRYSPLFQTYLSLLEQATISQETLESVVNMSDLTMNDINAIIHINESINI